MLKEAMAMATAEGHEAARQLRTEAEAHFAARRWGEAVETFERVWCVLNAVLCCFYTV